MLENETNEEMILKLIAPYISNPLVIAAALGYIAVFVPLIEELFKPLAVWIFARKIESPAQGFAMGLLSGASFALVESLNASGAGTESWPVIVTIRAGTSMLHIMATGLVGWGIVSAFRERRILRLVAAYLSAVLIHGIWNACAVGAGFSMVGEVIGNPEWLVNILPATAGGMFVLAVGMFLLLAVANKKMRISPVPILQSDTPAAISGSGDATGSQMNDGVQ
jgi:RsiW-degrading membrane proteinase PrsW (M82 family)